MGRPIAVRQPVRLDLTAPTTICGGRQMRRNRIHEDAGASTAHRALLPNHTSARRALWREGKRAAAAWHRRQACMVTARQPSAPRKRAVRKPHPELRAVWIPILSRTGSGAAGTAPGLLVAGGGHLGAGRTIADAISSMSSAMLSIADAWYRLEASSCPATHCGSRGAGLHAEREVRR